MGVIGGLASGLPMKAAVKNESGLVPGMRIDLFMRGLRGLRTHWRGFGLKQAPD